MLSPWKKAVAASQASEEAKAEKAAAKRYSFVTGTKGGALAPMAHTNPARITKVLRSLEKHPPPAVPAEAQEAAQEAVKRALHSLDEDLTEHRVQGLMALAEWINNAFGAPAEALGYELRKESVEEPARSSLSASSAGAAAAHVEGQQQQEEEMMDADLLRAIEMSKIQAIADDEARLGIPGMGY